MAAGAHARRGTASGGYRGGTGMQFAAAGIEQLWARLPFVRVHCAQNGPLFLQFRAAGLALIQVGTDGLFLEKIQLPVEIEGNVPGYLRASHTKSPSAVLIF